MKNKILVFDDIIDLEYQKKIKKILLSDCQYKGYEFPWYFTQDVTSHTDTNSQKRSAFYHGYVINDDDFWEKSFLRLKSIKSANENIKNLIPFSVFKNDWELLLRCVNIKHELFQKNDKLCEQILSSDSLNFDQISIN